jgi:hypothetical protein
MTERGARAVVESAQKASRKLFVIEILPRSHTSARYFGDGSEP